MCPCECLLTDGCDRYAEGPPGCMHGPLNAMREDEGRLLVGLLGKVFCCAKRHSLLQEEGGVSHGRVVLRTEDSTITDLGRALASPE